MYDGKVCVMMCGNKLTGNQMLCCSDKCLKLFQEWWNLPDDVRPKSLREFYESKMEVKSE